MQETQDFGTANFGISKEDKEGTIQSHDNVLVVTL